MPKFLLNYNILVDVEDKNEAMYGVGATIYKQVEQLPGVVVCDLYTVTCGESYE